jgi:hypothetical protein
MNEIATPTFWEMAGAFLGVLAIMCIPVLALWSGRKDKEPE